MNYERLSNSVYHHNIENAMFLAVVLQLKHLRSVYGIRGLQPQQFELWIDFSNKDRKIVVRIILREAQNYTNNKESFSYFESLADKAGSFPFRIKPDETTK